MNALSLLIAGALDLAVGDPPWLPHPVRGFGRIIEWVRRRSPRRGPGARAAGAGLAVGLPLTAYLVTAGLLRLARAGGPIAVGAVTVYCLHTSLAYRELARGVRGVHRALTGAGLSAARGRLSGLVGRDTARLDEEGVRRAAVETAAEGFLDGWLSPLFWLAVGGVPALVAYRAVNTLDSMVGYRDPEHADFGWASARLDDAANALSARLSTPLIVAAALPGGMTRPRAAMDQMRRAWGARTAHPSPNAGHPEAAFAAVVGCRLGGRAHYGDRREDRPRMNPSADPPSGPDVLRAHRLLSASTGLATALTVLVLWYGAPLLPPLIP